MSQDPILVVEESSVLSDLIRDLLEATGFSVVQVMTSKDALALFHDRKFSGFLVDADLPGTTGVQLIEDVRSQGSLESLPGLLLVGPDFDESQIPSDWDAKRLIHKPIDPVELITRVRGAVGGATPSPGAAQSGFDLVTAPLATPQVRTSRSPGDGKIITVFSLKGGVGCSTIASNLAVCLHRLWQESTALVDLSLESGALNILLDIMPTATIDELASLNGNMTPEATVQYLVAHKSGVNLLSAPPSPERAELIDGVALRKALGYLKEQFDYVVIDTASTFAEHTLLALEMADHIVLPMIGDISSIRATTTAIDIFQALSIPEERVQLVFNELFPKMGLSRKHAETSLSVITMPLPYGGARLLDSINLGDPIAHSEPNHPFSEAIAAIAVQLSHPDADLRSTDKGGLFSGMRKLVKA